MAKMPNEIKVDIAIGTIIEPGEVTREWLESYLAHLARKGIGFSARIETETGVFVVTSGTILNG